VQQDDRSTGGRAGVEVADVEDPGRDLFDFAEGGASRLLLRLGQG
jgi:hypothetical protein